MALNKVLFLIFRVRRLLTAHDEGDKACEHGDFHQFLSVSVVTLVCKNENRDDGGGKGDSGDNQEKHGVVTLRDRQR